MTEFDFSVLNWIQDNLKCGFLDFLMPKITFLGDKGLIWLLIAIILLITKKYRKTGIIMLVGMALGVLFGNLIIKNLIARTRPYDIETTIKLIISKPTGYSFPSGHTLASIISATVLSLTSKKFAIFSIPLAIMIAFSRMYLYVHYPSDILGATILGVAIGFFTYFFANKTTNKKKLRS